MRDERFLIFIWLKVSHDPKVKCAEWYVVQVTNFLRDEANCNLSTCVHVCRCGKSNGLTPE